MRSTRTPRRVAAATALALCLQVPATAMAIPQIGDPPSSNPPPSMKIGDTPSDYPGTSNEPQLTTAAQTATPAPQATASDGFDWTDAIIGAGAATALLVVIGGGTFASRSHTRAHRLA